ncbi:OmpW/AlkL family protein [Kordiimonas gwangyangensis]|uniref:OmpW/AlkL family protein n=2 Tax=Kordiimonas gwangyangensis TaxID=288022 RepID=UPI000372A6AE|nr:OmpW family protein [Kordiimonas gwangyangensis]
MRISNLLKASVCALALGAVATPAMAEGGNSPWLVRLRAIDVAPDESSTVSIGGEAKVDSSIVPELDITYFFTQNVAAELILATSKHDVSALGTAIGDVDLGHTWALPPTLLLQYHFNPEGDVKPYLGAGLNYTFFYSSNPGAVNDIEYDNGFGYALQAGVDFRIKENWYFNVDAKKLWLNTDVSINGGAVTADVDLDPWVLGVGFGYRF